jgi:hypothetical protein
VRAKAHLGRALLSYLAGDVLQTRSDLLRAAALAAAGDDPAVQAIAEVYISYSETVSGELEAAQQRVTSVRRLATSGPPWCVPKCR